MTIIGLFPKGEDSDLTAFWLNFGDNPEPSVRQNMVYLTVREVAMVGPGSFNTMGVCDALDLTYPMVNHYFGNRDGLIAEAGFVVYELYISRLWENVEAAKADPESRLRAWMNSHVRLNVELNGWGAVLNYPHFSQTIFRISEEKFGQRKAALFELNVTRLAQLIRDFRAGSVTKVDYTVDNYPRAELMADQKIVELTGTISLSLLGLSVWKSGGHSPSSGIAELEKMKDAVAKAHIDNMLMLAKS